MPRRWTNNPQRARTTEPQEQESRPQTYEAMARALVSAGKASPQILSPAGKYRPRRTDQTESY